MDRFKAEQEKVANKDPGQLIEIEPSSSHEQCTLRCYYNDDCQDYNAEKSPTGFDCKLYNSAGAACIQILHSPRWPLLAVPYPHLGMTMTAKKRKNGIPHTRCYPIHLKNGNDRSGEKNFKNVIAPAANFSHCNHCHY